MMYAFPSELYVNLCTQTQSRRRMQSRRNSSVQLHALFPQTTSKVDNMYFYNLVYLEHCLTICCLIVTTYMYHL